MVHVGSPKGGDLSTLAVPRTLLVLEMAHERTFSITLLGTEVRLQSPQILLHGDAFLQPSRTSSRLYTPTVASGGHGPSPAEPAGTSHGLTSAQLNFPGGPR